MPPTREITSWVFCSNSHWILESNGTPHSCGNSDTTQGMERRLGTASRPSVALQFAHVHTNQTKRTQRMSQMLPHTTAWFQLALAQFAELLAWLAWLRASELFELRWKDIECVQPSRRPRYGLPPGSGALLLQLLEATKGSQTSTADMVVAYQTSSGFQPGKIFEELLQARSPCTSDSELLFKDEHGEQWTSSYFRNTHIYPWLEEQWKAGDPLLKTHCPKGPEERKEKFYSMSMFRRGGQTHIAQKQMWCVRKATGVEINEHG